MRKIKTIPQLKTICAWLRSEGKTISMVTGCFDIIHHGHIDLFRFAKQHSHALIVGLDNDDAIEKAKGTGRPIFSFEEREKVLSEIQSIDYIFKIAGNYDFSLKQAEAVHDTLITELCPHILVTDPLSDRYWKNKLHRAKKYTIRFLPYRGRPKTSSSTSVIQKMLEKEF